MNYLILIFTRGIFPVYRNIFKFLFVFGLIIISNDVFSICRPECPEGYKCVRNRCELKDYYECQWPDGSICLKDEDGKCKCECSYGCKTCHKNERDCTSCKTGYILSNHKCIAKTISCSPGKYLESGKDTCTSCPVGSYCPGFSNHTYDGQEKGRNLCKDLIPLNTYIHSPENSNKSEQCYLTTRAGKYVNTIKGAEEECPKDSYCTGGIIIKYGKTGGMSGICPYEYPYSEKGNSSIDNCYKNCLFTDTNVNNCKTVFSGKLTKAGENNCRCVDCENGYVLSSDGKQCLIECYPGYYLKKGETFCRLCEEGYYCPKEKK